MESNNTEPMVPYSVVELINGSHALTVKRLVAIIIVLSIIILAALAVIGVIVYENAQFDTISYEQDGNGNNVIGDNNRSYFDLIGGQDEPEIDCTPET